MNTDFTWPQWPPSDHLNTAHDLVTSVVCNWTVALMLHAKSHVKKYFEAMVFKLVGIEISILHLWLLLNPFDVISKPRLLKVSSLI